jgi:hypothetical protein
MTKIMPRPEFPTGCVLPVAAIYEINAQQRHYDEDPERAEQEQREEQNRRDEERQRDIEQEQAQY